MPLMGISVVLNVDHWLFQQSNTYLNVFKLYSNLNYNKHYLYTLGVKYVNCVHKFEMAN